MATEVVELTGDEAGLLRSLDNAIAKENAHEQQLAKTAAAGSEAGDALEEAFEKVAKSDDKALKGLLRDLNRISPEARKVGGALKDHFVEAGKAGYKSIDQVIEEIRKIDPEAAAAAEAMRDELAAAADDVGSEIEQSANKGSKSWGDFTEEAVNKIGGMVVAYLSVSTVIQEANRYLEEHNRLLKESHGEQLTLAEAQQQASKNLASFTAEERQYLLDTATAEIARETGFSNLAQLTNALGTAASSGADAAGAENAVRQAARVEILSPDDIDETAAGAVAVQRQTGLADARQAIALLQTAGTQASVVDPAKLVQELPKALTATQTVPEQDREEAARQVAALYGVVTKAGNDVQGAASATFVSTLAGTLEQFFTDLPGQGRDARSELQRLENKKTLTESDEFRIQELRSLIPVLEKAADPKTLFGRIEAIQASPELRNEVIGSGIGETQFKVFSKSLFDANSDSAADLGNAVQSIKADVESFEQSVAEMKNGTAQLRLAFSEQQRAAARAVDLNFDIEGSTTEEIRSTTEQVLLETRQAGITAAIGAKVDEYGIRPSTFATGGLAGDTAAEESVDAINRLYGRRNAIGRDADTPENRRKIARLDSEIARIRALVIDQASNLEGGSLDAAADAAGFRSRDFSRQGATAQADYFRELSQEFRRAATAMEETAKNTRPRPGDPAAAQRQSIDLANQRASQ